MLVSSIQQSDSVIYIFFFRFFFIVSYYKILNIGNSLAVQCLGPCNLAAEGPGSIPGQRSHKPRGVAKKKKKD